MDTTEQTNNLRDSRVITVQTQNITGALGPFTIYPIYKNGQLMITEYTLDANEIYTPPFFGIFGKNWPCKHCKKVFSVHEKYTYRCGDVDGQPDLMWKTIYEPIGKLEYLEQLYDKKTSR